MLDFQPVTGSQAGAKFPKSWSSCESRASPCLLDEAAPEQVTSFVKIGSMPPDEYAAADGLQCRVGWQSIAFLMLFPRWRLRDALCNQRHI